MPSALGERAARDRRKGERPIRMPQAKVTPFTTRSYPPALGRGPDSGRRETAARPEKPSILLDSTTVSPRLVPKHTTQHKPEAPGNGHNPKHTTQHKPEAPKNGHNPTQPNSEAPVRGSKPTQPNPEADNRRAKKARFARTVTADEIQADSDQDEPFLTPANNKPSKTERIAITRNRERVERADAMDQKLLSKYLPATAHDFLPNTIPGPDDAFTPPAWLMTAVDHADTECTTCPIRTLARRHPSKHRAPPKL
jgi:hypothetical protein